jgi:hypothetical protein
MTDLDELRHAVAAEFGLPPQAVPFLTGTTLEEVEASAGALAKLLGSSAHEPEQAEPLADLFANAATEKARRQRALVETLHGRPQQARDAHGRFAGGFDGGCRTPVPAPADPYADHDRLVADLSLLTKIGRGGF